jgi:hypothetical protein
MIVVGANRLRDPGTSVISASRFSRGAILQYNVLVRRPAVARCCTVDHTTARIEKDGKNTEYRSEQRSISSD